MKKADADSSMRELAKILWRAEFDCHEDRARWLLDLSEALPRSLGEGDWPNVVHNVLAVAISEERGFEDPRFTDPDSLPLICPSPPPPESTVEDTNTGGTENRGTATCGEELNSVPCEPQDAQEATREQDGCLSERPKPAVPGVNSGQEASRAQQCCLSETPPLAAAGSNSSDALRTAGAASSAQITMQPLVRKRGLQRTPLAELLNGRRADKKCAAIAGRENRGYCGIDELTKEFLLVQADLPVRFNVPSGAADAPVRCSELVVAVASGGVDADLPRVIPVDAHADVIENELERPCGEVPPNMPAAPAPNSVESVPDDRRCEETTVVDQQTDEVSQSNWLLERSRVFLDRMPISSRPAQPERDCAETVFDENSRNYEPAVGLQAISAAKSPPPKKRSCDSVTKVSPRRPKSASPGKPTRTPESMSPTKMASNSSKRRKRVCEGSPPSLVEVPRLSTAKAGVIPKAPHTSPTRRPPIPLCVCCQQPPEAPKVSVHCGHLGCSECWARWMLQKFECPVCRRKVRPNNLILLKGWGD